MFAVSPAGPDYRNGCKACNSFDVAPCSRDSIGGGPIEVRADIVRPDGRLPPMTRPPGPLVGGSSHGVRDLGGCNVDVRLGCRSGVEDLPPRRGAARNSGAITWAQRGQNPVNSQPGGPRPKGTESFGTLQPAFCKPSQPASPAQPSPAQPSPIRSVGGLQIRTLSGKSASGAFRELD